MKQLQEKVAWERDERAYKLLFLHFYNSLFRFAFGFVKNREASEEVVSDVMLKIWSIKEGLSHIANLKVYLYKATKNTALNYCFRNARHSFQDIENIDQAIDQNMNTPEETLLKNEWNREMMMTVQKLPPKCRMVYNLIREDRFSYKEVAALMEISENTVDRHLNNALHKLVKAMKIYLD